MSAPFWGPPANLRLVVVDIETCVAADGRHRIVSLGAAVARRGRATPRHQWLVNPGVKVDDFTRDKVHHLSDEVLADEPSFADVLPAFLSLLERKEDETLVLAAHWTGFDIRWIRSEIERVGGEVLPLLPLLDTAGPILALAGVESEGSGLDAVAKALGVANPEHHDALNDALVAAKIAVIALDRAAEVGHTDLPVLLARLGGGSTREVGTTGGASAKAGDEAVRVVVSDAHALTHAGLPSPDRLDEWRDWTRQCAVERCDQIDTRSVGLSPAAFREIAEDAIRHCVAADDRVGAASALGALTTVLGDAADPVAAFREVAGLLGGTHECGDAVPPCPACRGGQSCPVATWPSVLARPLADGEDALLALWNPAGPERGLLALRASAPILADFALAEMLSAWRSLGGLRAAALVAAQVRGETATSDPAVVEVLAQAAAESGEVADIEAALADCLAAQKAEEGGTPASRRWLATRCGDLEVRLRRLRAGPRQHHPTTPKRVARPARFAARGR